MRPLVLIDSVHGEIALAWDGAAWVGRLDRPIARPTTEADREALITPERGG
jgi:hypothetical protein